MTKQTLSPADQILNLLPSVSDEAQLRFINSVLVSRLKVMRSQKILVNAVALNLSPGVKVKFKGKYGVTERGVVLKVNRTTATVRTNPGVSWRVSIALLEKDTGK